MSKISIEGNASGTGTLTIAAPNTNSNYTLTLPENTGTIVTTAGASALTTSGNLTFTGTGNRITGDFSNATVANRVAFQTSTVNGITRVNTIPNGTATESGFNFYNTAAVTTGEFGQLFATSSEISLRSAALSGGSFLPMTFYTGGSERMRIDTSGNLLVGTTTARNKLTLTGTVTTTPTLGTASGSAFFCNTDTAFGMMFGVSGGGQGWIQQQRVDGTGTAYALYLQPVGGETLVAGTTDNGAYNLQCNGTGVWGAGAYVNGSDERIKDDIAPIESGLDVVEKLNPVTYRYKESWSKDQSTQTGFIAQELLVALKDQNYVDGVVQQGGSEGYYSVAYQNIIPILTKAIQELKAITDTQAQTISALEARVAALENGE